MDKQMIEEAIAVTARNVEIAIRNEDKEKRNALVEQRNQTALAISRDALLQELEETEELEEGGFGFSMVESRLTY